jgi:hypothetical protein
VDQIDEKNASNYEGTSLHCNDAIDQRQLLGRKATVSNSQTNDCTWNDGSHES